MAAPTRPPRRSAAGRAPLAGLALAAAAVVILAACSTIGSFANLIEDLRDAGFTDVTANIDQRNTSALVVSADAPDDTTVEEAQDQAAEIVWTRFPRRFEGLRVTIDGERREWTYDELEEELGPRPEGLEEGNLGDDIDRVALFAIVGALVAGLVGVAVIGLIVFLVVRSNRRNRPVPPTPQPWMPPGPPPPDQWTPASAPPARPTPGSSTPLPPPPGPSLAKPPTGAPAGSHARPGPVGRRTHDPDARRLGRRPRGPAPDEAHTPPGWG